MKITLNGESVTLQEGSSVSELLTQYQLDPSVTIAEINLNIVPKEKMTSTFLKEGDVVELIRFMGGGQ